MIISAETPMALATVSMTEHINHALEHIILDSKRLRKVIKQQTIPSYQRSYNELETTIKQLYKKGITTRDIFDLIDKMYGHYYTPQTISSFIKVV